MAKKAKKQNDKHAVYMKLDKRVISWAKSEGAKLGLGYQTFLNMELLKRAGFAK